jgi:hypothetical protein
MRAACISPISLHGCSGQRGVDVAGLHEAGHKPRLGEARIKPLRQWTRLKADYSQGKAKGFEELHECVGVALHLHFLHDLPGCVDNAHRFRHSSSRAVSQWVCDAWGPVLKHPGTPFTITYRETATFPLSLGRAHYGIYDAPRLALHV